MSAAITAAITSGSTAVTTDTSAISAGSTAAATAAVVVSDVDDCFVVMITHWNGNYVITTLRAVTDGFSSTDIAVVVGRAAFTSTVVIVDWIPTMPCSSSIMAVMSCTKMVFMSP